MKHCMGCMELYGDEFMICPYCGYIEGTPAEEKIHMEPGTLLHNRYIIGKVLGYGGFGVTYIGWDGKLEQKVAIKEYLPGEFSTRMPGQTMVTVFGGDKSEQFRAGQQKFIEEAKRLARFKSEPGIVRILDTFEENSTAYIVMEFLDGETLSSYLQRTGTMSEDDAINLLTPVMQSLQVVHDAGILHRDIAPDNIFITKTGEVKLIDFGASRYATTSHSRSLTVIIKPGYSAEEQYRSRGDQGPHTDVYSLGATLYKMITGKTPPDAMERRAKYENKNRDILVPPHVVLRQQKSKQISIDRENAILNAMNVRIEDRTPTVGKLLEELNSEKSVKRKQGKIKQIDLYRWPLWLKILLPTLACALIVFGVLLLTGVIKLEKYKTEIVLPENTVVVPDVEGKTKEEALSALESERLGASVTSRESEYLAVGTVITQDPTPGAYALINTKVNLVISKGKGASEAVDGVSTVPYLIDSTKEEALKDIEKTGLVLGEIKEEWSDSAPEGTVIKQSLEFDTKVQKGTEISITVSLGGKPFNMPDVVGKKMEDADAQLKDLGLTVKIEQKADAGVPVGQVISQNTPAGSQVRKGDIVTIVVSSGVPTAAVPNVVGVSASTAESALKEAGFKVKKQEQYSSGVAKGTVISQSPNANTTQAEGTEITIVVSKGAQPVVPDTVTQPTSPAPQDDQPPTEPSVTQQKITVANVIGKTSGEAKAALENQGLTVSINYDYSSDAEKGRVIRQNPSAGTSVKAGTTVAITVGSGPKTVSLTVFFNANGGSVSTASKSLVQNGTYGNLPVPTRDYYRFDGWYTSASDGTKVTESTTVSAANDHTLYAHWIENERSGWVPEDQIPSDAKIVEQKTQYRYSYYKTTSTYTKSSKSGYVLDKTEWEITSKGSFDYAPDKTSYLMQVSQLSNIKKDPLSAYENESDKRVVNNSSSPVYYLYYHWCRGTYTNGPIDRKITYHGPTSEFPAFHYFTSTKNVSYNRTADAYEYPNASVCKDTIWYEKVAVYKCEYTEYKKKYYYHYFTDWTDWSDNQESIGSKDMYETKTLYEYVRK